MQKIHDFEITIEEYARKGKENEFPQISKCESCEDTVIKHGFYQRFVIKGNTNYVIFIQRYRCKHCNSTVSILPIFLLPHFQRSLEDIVKSIKEYLLKKKYSLLKRQVHFYCQRFKKNISGMISFFRELVNIDLSFGNSKNEKATKLIEMIKGSPVPTFSQRYFNHFNISFMAI